jgi:release factor glutamine methyltransferase
MGARRSSDLAHLTGGAALAAAVETLAAVSDTPRLDAEVLLAFATGRTRASLLAFPERTLDVAAAERFTAFVARRATGEPLAYLTGEREFFSLPLAVSPDVLIPRAETELLVDLTLRAVGRRARPTVLDVGSGSGAIAIAVKWARPDAQVTASDVSAAALGAARANSERLGVAIRWVESAWFAALGDARFDVIVSNPPYVRSEDVSGALGFEPRLALDGGTDGLDAYRALLAAAAPHLALPHGVLLLEHGHEQRAELTELAVANGWRVTAAHDDLAGRPRVLELGPGGAP